MDGQKRDCIGRLLRIKSDGAELYRTFVAKAELDAQFLQCQTVMPEPHKNLLGPLFDVGILLPDVVAASKILSNRSGHDIGGAQQIEKVRASLTEGKRATYQVKLSFGVKAEDAMKKREQPLVRSGVGADRVVIRHPEDLLSVMPEQRGQERGRVNDAKRLFGNVRLKLPEPLFL